MCNRSKDLVCALSPRLRKEGGAFDYAKRWALNKVDSVKTNLDRVGTDVANRVKKAIIGAADQAGQRAGDAAVTQGVRSLQDQRPKIENEVKHHSNTAGNSFIDGILNNKQLNSWMWRGGSGIAASLLLSTFRKNKALAWLLGMGIGMPAGNYLHKHWKGDLGKTWESVQKDWSNR